MITRFTGSTEMLSMDLSSKILFVKIIYRHSALAWKFFILCFLKCISLQTCLLSSFRSFIKLFFQRSSASESCSESFDRGPQRRSDHPQESEPIGSDRQQDLQSPQRSVWRYCNDLTTGWQNLNPLSHPNATLAPQARQAKLSSEILNYSLSH